MPSGWRPLQPRGRDRSPSCKPHHWLTGKSSLPLIFEFWFLYLRGFHNKPALWLRCLLLGSRPLKSTELTVKTVNINNAVLKSYFDLQISIHQPKILLIEDCFKFLRCFIVITSLFGTLTKFDIFDHINSSTSPHYLDPFWKRCRVPTLYQGQDQLWGPNLRNMEHQIRTRK